MTAARGIGNAESAPDARKQHAHGEYSGNHEIDIVQPASSDSAPEHVAEDQQKNDALHRAEEQDMKIRMVVWISGKSFRHP